MSHSAESSNTKGFTAPTRAGRLTAGSWMPPEIPADTWKVTEGKTVFNATRPAYCALEIPDNHPAIKGGSSTGEERMSLSIPGYAELVHPRPLPPAAELVWRDAAGILRCLVTRNPCGTDTWMVGKPCECGSCQLYLRKQRDDTVPWHDREIKR